MSLVSALSVKAFDFNDVYSIETFSKQVYQYLKENSNDLTSVDALFAETNEIHLGTINDILGNMYHVILKQKQHTPEHVEMWIKPSPLNHSEITGLPVNKPLSLLRNEGEKIVMDNVANLIQSTKLTEFDLMKAMKHHLGDMVVIDQEMCSVYRNLLTVTNVAKKMWYRDNGTTKRRERFTIYHPRTREPIGSVMVRVPVARDRETTPITVYSVRINNKDGGFTTTLKTRSRDETMIEIMKQTVNTMNNH